MYMGLASRRLKVFNLQIVQRMELVAAKRNEQPLKTPRHRKETELNLYRACEMLKASVWVETRPIWEDLEYVAQTGEKQTPSVTESKL